MMSYDVSFSTLTPQSINKAIKAIEVGGAQLDNFEREAQAYL